MDLEEQTPYTLSYVYLKMKNVRKMLKMAMVTVFDKAVVLSLGRRVCTAHFQEILRQEDSRTPQSRFRVREPNFWSFGHRKGCFRVQRPTHGPLDPFGLGKLQS
jgi:hypothetical protein